MKPVDSTTWDELPTALANFDRLPDSAFVRANVVAGIRGCSVSTVWRHVNEQLIPAPTKLGPRLTVWNVGTLRQSLAVEA